jgi:hypothetical protein
MSATYRAMVVVAAGELRSVDRPMREPPSDHVRIPIET